MPEEVLLGEHALFFEVAQGVLGGVEDLCCGFGDEGGGVLGGLPDDVDLLGVLPGVLELASMISGLPKKISRSMSGGIPSFSEEWTG
ncbi:MAG: hypothetical protein ACF8LL_04440 [Phycisphaerales bacterium]